jgi:hypothetical protein
MIDKMGRGRRGRWDAPLVAEFADAHGIKLRAAQGHRARQSVQWLAYLQQKGYGDADGAPPPGAVVPSEIRAPVIAGGAIEDEMVARHESLWRDTMTAAALAMAENRLAQGAQLAKACKETMAAVEVARRLQKERQVALRELVPLREYEVALEAVRTAAALVQHLPRELADACNPGHPEVAEAALREWRDGRWNSHLDAVAEAMSV